MLLASALMAASALGTGSAGAAPIRADMWLNNGVAFEQVQMRGHGGGGGGAGFSRGGGSFGGGAAMSRGPSFGGSAAMSRGPAISGGAVMNRGSAGNFTSNRVVRGGNWADGRRFSDFRDGRFRRGFRGPRFAFGFGPSYYDYGYYDYPYDYGYYDDYAYGDDYVAVSPGVAGGDCAQRFRSYDPSTGTYLGYDGLRHPCP
jgi:hypothetical protein